MKKIDKPIRVMELRSTYRWGGGPDKTVLNSALMHDPARIWTLVTYLRSDWDTEFSIGEKARSMGLNYEEVIEKKTIDLAAFKRIVHLVKEYNIDILHSREYKSNLYAFLMKIFFCPKLKIVTTAHGWVGKGFKLSFYYTLDKLLVASFDRNFILFKDMVKLFIRKPKPEKTVVIHNAIDPEVWSPVKYRKKILREELSIPETSAIIGYVGRIMPEKDIITMIKVADELINIKKMDAYFILVGESKNAKYMGLLERFVNKKELVKRFLFVGTRKNIQEVYCDFDVFLMTSIQEGFPNSLLESMAMQVPSVVSAIDGIPDIICDKQSGMLCRTGDVLGYCNAIEKVLKDSELQKRLVSTSRKIVENELSFKKRLLKMEDAYEQLLLER